MNKRPKYFTTLAVGGIVWTHQVELHRGRYGLAYGRRVRSDGKVNKRAVRCPHFATEAQISTAKEHGEADKACGRRWFSDGCQCAACRIVRKALSAEASTWKF